MASAGRSLAYVQQNDRSLPAELKLILEECIPEVLSTEALRLAAGLHRLIAPDLLHAEAGNALWQKVQGGSLQPGEARDILRSISAAPLEVSRLRPLSALAVESCVTAYNRPSGLLQTRHGGTLDAQSARTPAHTQLGR